MSFSNSTTFGPIESVSVCSEIRRVLLVPSGILVRLVAQVLLLLLAWKKTPVKVLPLG